MKRTSMKNQPLFFRNKCLPGLIIIENTNLSNLTTRFVNYFRIKIEIIIGCINYTLLILHGLSGSEWGGIRGRKVECWLNRL